MSLYAVSDKSDPQEAQSACAPTQAILQRLLLFGLCGLLIFAVLAFGAVEEWSTFAFETGAAALFLVWAALQLRSEEVELSKNPLYLPSLLFFILILAQIVLRRTAYAYVTKHEALQYVSYGIVMLVAAECAREADTRRKFTVVMIVFGALYAFFALAQDLTPNGKIFWLRQPRFGGGFYGSYVNHDHYAGLMEMLAPIPLVLGMGRILNGGQRALVAFSGVLMASTIFLSRSRGGMFAFVVELLVFSALVSGRKRNLRPVLGAIALCVLILAFLVFVGKGQVLGRFGELSPGMRLNMTRDSLRMFVEHPVWGYGLGTFPTVYPSRRSFYTNLFVNAAHNDYAQLLVEGGLLGFGLMLWFLIRLYKNGVPTSRRWEFEWNEALSLAALLGCTGMLLHSFVDFNLQIPANAAFFYVLCALAASGPSSQPFTGTGNSETHRSPDAVLSQRRFERSDERVEFDEI